MRFENKQERDSLIESFKLKAEELTEKRKAAFLKANDSTSNALIKYDCRTEYDEISRNDKDEIVECSGDIYVFYIKQPKLLDAIKILEAGGVDKKLSKSYMAWDAMIMKEESSPEVFQDRIKLGYLFNMIEHIDALLSDQKKR